ncbi:MAG: hypothetical protein RLZZ387_3921 [Chloroflexota bacterium]|jgi:pimeloyl-ACP methyl ester carboxylesterase
MTSWHANDVEANGIRLHYTRTGGDKPPVLLTHGFSDDGLCWTPVAKALEADYDVIMLDARGHGHSDGPEEGYSSAHHAADVAGVIAALGLRRPAVLGHSMGAATALALASGYPELPGAILLEDPPQWWVPQPDAEAGRDAWRQRMWAWVVALKRKTREELVAQQRAETPEWSEEELGPWADAKLRLSINVMSRTPNVASDAGQLGRIACPALLITSDPERGGLVTPEGATALQALVPQLQVARITEAGHSIRRDQLGRYLEVVRGFLAEHAR